MNNTEFKKNLLSEMRIVVTEVNDDNTKVSDALLIKAMTINEELKNLGYILSTEDSLKACRDDKFLENFKSLLGDVKAKPMYPDFPNQVMNIDEAQFRFHQMLHYFSTYGVESLTGETVHKGWLPNVEDTEKTKSDINLLDYKVLQLVNENDIYNLVYTKLLSKRERLTIPEKELLNYTIPCISYDTIKDTKVLFKENLLDIFYTVFSNEDMMTTAKKNEILHSICQHTGDVWKCIDFTLNTCKWHFRTSQKRMLVKLLELYPIVDFKSNLILSNKKADRIKTLLEFLSYNTYSRSIEHKNAVYNLRDGNLKSWESKVKYLLSTKDDNALDFISSHPGTMIRMVAWLIRLGYNSNAIYEKLANNAKSLSIQTLVTVLNFFSSDKAENLCKGRGERSKNEITSVIDVFNKLIRDALKAKEIFKDKKVYLDMDNYDLIHSVLECNNKSSEGGYIRSGLSYKIPDHIKRLMAFVYWNDEDYRVDLDIHGSALNEIGRNIDIGWDSGFIDKGLVFSGDITHSDAAEYIDIDLNNTDIKEVSFNINSYTGQRFKDIDTVFVGLMAVNSLEQDVKLYDPKNCFYSHFLKGDNTFINYGYINVKDRYLKFIGTEDDRSSTYSNGNKETNFSLVQYISYLLLNAAIVDSKEEADVILTMEKSDDDKAVSLLDNNFFMD